MKQIFYLFAILMFASIFCVVLPYPIFSNHTNINEAVAYDINNFVETELSASTLQEATLLPLKFKQINYLLPVGKTFEIFDIKTGQSAIMKRTGGTHHVDAEPVNDEAAQNIYAISGKNFSWKRHAVLLKINEVTYVPASLAAYPHGYSTTGTTTGHFCIHFLDSKTDGTKEKDFSHQKCVKKALKLGKKFLKNIDDTI